MKRVTRKSAQDGWLIVLLLLLGVAAISKTIAQEDFDWKQFEGAEIRVGASNTEWTDYAKNVTAEFESLTGINVVWETLPEDQYRQKMAIEFAAGQPSSSCAY